jgi:hypothetical protein
MTASEGRAARIPGRNPRGGHLPLAWSGAGVEGVACLFTVRSCGAGWRLEGEGLESMVFAHGGDAERQGRRVAKSVARLGRDAKVNVYDAGDRLVGAISYYACRAAPGPEAARRYPWAPDAGHLRNPG